MDHKKHLNLILSLLILTLILIFVQRAKQNRTYTIEGDKTLADYYNESQNLRGPQSEKVKASFLAVGDIMLSRNVALAIKQSGNANYPFTNFAEVLKSTDFNFANLESPVAEKNPIVGGHAMVFSSPKEYVQALTNYKFKMVSLANNHALDQGLNGLKYTLKFLDENQINHAGAGNNLEEAWATATINANGVQLCFFGVSYASINDNGKTSNAYVARMEDTERLKSTVTKLKSSEMDCDFVIATMHAGTEYVRQPNQTQINFAHNAIDFGADMVIGHHPHWIQTIEKYKDKYIFYSLGNFIFDQYFSRETQEGLTLKITLSKNAPPLQNMKTNFQGVTNPAALESVELIPVIIENAQPRRASVEETKSILNKINQPGNILK